MSLARNVLIFHSGALGDFVLSFPVALALARLYPTSRVRYVTPASKGRLASQVLGVEWADVESGFSSLYADGAAVPEAVAKLVAGSHRIVSYASSPGDVFSRRVAELAPRATLMHLRTIPAEAGVHALKHVCSQCSAERAVGGAVEQIAGLLARQGLVRRAWGGRGVVIHPGAGSEAKCWPVENFRELALRLKDAGTDVRFVLGEVERERMPGAERRALESCGDVVVPGDYVGLLEELLSAAAFVGNDSGPGHLAAMAGVPTVSLFGPTDPGVWSPVGPTVEVIRSGGPDMGGIGVEAVFGRTVELLRREPVRNAPMGQPNKSAEDD